MMVLNLRRELERSAWMVSVFVTSTNLTPRFMLLALKGKWMVGPLVAGKGKKNATREARGGMVTAEGKRE